MAFSHLLQNSSPNFVGAAETIGQCGAVAATPWSISFAEQSWSITNDPLLPTARLQSGDGSSFASPYETVATTEAIDGVQLDDVLKTASIANLPGTNVYPFLSFAYLLLNTTWTPEECEDQRNVLKVRSICTAEFFFFLKLTSAVLPLGPQRPRCPANCA